MFLVASKTKFAFTARLAARVDLAFAEEVTRFNEEITLRTCCGTYDASQGRVRPSPLDTSACPKARCTCVPWSTTWSIRIYAIFFYIPHSLHAQERGVDHE